MLVTTAVPPPTGNFLTSWSRPANVPRQAHVRSPTTIMLGRHRTLQKYNPSQCPSKQTFARLNLSFCLAHEDHPPPTPKTPFSKHAHNLQIHHRIHHWRSHRVHQCTLAVRTRTLACPPARGSGVRLLLLRKHQTEPEELFFSD